MEQDPTCESGQPCKDLLLQICTRPATGPYENQRSSVQSIMGATDNFRLLCFIKSLLFPLRGRNAASPKFSKPAYFTSPFIPNLHQMTTSQSETTLDGRRYAAGVGRPSRQHFQRRRGLACGRSRLRWMRSASRTRRLANITLKERVDWYSQQMGGSHPFVKSWRALTTCTNTGPSSVSLSLSPPPMPAAPRRGCP